MTPDRARDTIFALSSGRPPAAVSVIRTSGPAALAAAAALMRKVPASRRPALRELRRPGTSDLLDNALILRFDGPRSATGENIVEYQCHGGRAVVDGILTALAALPGMRAAEPGEFTRRAFVNGRIDLTEAEGLADLLEAETESQRRAALMLAEGGLKRQVEIWRRQLVDLSARAEAAIDYVGDEDETAIDGTILASAAQQLADELKEWLSRPRTEPLKDGVRVVFAGPPNAGKSSLVNALTFSDKAIVTDIAGTTRDVIEVPVALDGTPFILVDTAGLREGVDRVEAIGVDRALDQIVAADILVWLGDPEEIPVHRMAIPVHSRADEAGRGDVAPGSLSVSAVTGSGLAELTQRLVTEASRILPVEGELGLNRRQAKAITAALEALEHSSPDDLVLTAEALRGARSAFDELSGRAGTEEMLDALFGHFCLGK